MLRKLPSVDEILESGYMLALTGLLPHSVLLSCARSAVDEARNDVLSGKTDSIDVDAITESAFKSAIRNLKPSLRKVINATGVVIHTNLGRSPLAKEAVDAVDAVAEGYSTLEYDTDAMQRGSRHDHVAHLLRALTGAEDAMVVNNNAAAVLLVLNEFSRSHEAIVSRGELIEIGGSFRIPDIMEMSGSTMVEVGTTNKTRKQDYVDAMSKDTSMLLKVHPSNYRIVGFTESASLAELVEIAAEENLKREAMDLDDPYPVLVYEDQGAGLMFPLPFD
ncbi:MAG: L-seryl-tRNA(Sec) selenium transferase, partial [Eggerthellaceae bacterium]|nr:L-seryl-tRNA(Sec) selenium transferase [Eggerthellaceae bacterium]